jgi:hypothetical protein
MIESSPAHAAHSPGAPAGSGIRRLNWGCGTHPEPGWLNSDSKEGPGIDISCDIRAGLPLEDDSFDYVASIHALPELPYPDSFRRSGSSDACSSPTASSG